MVTVAIAAIVTVFSWFGDQDAGGFRSKIAVVLMFLEQFVI